MKKIILFITLLLGVGIDTYSSESRLEFNQVNKKINDEFILFFGGYDKIYSRGIDVKNIDFLVKEVQYNKIEKKDVDYKNIIDGGIINLKLDEYVELKNISNIKKLKVVKKSYKNSSLTYEKKDGNLDIIFSSVGEYQIAFTDKNNETKVITFLKESEYIPPKNELENNIERAYSSDEVDFLNKNLTLLKVFYPDSEEVKNGLFYSLDLNRENQNYEEVKKVAKILVTKYELDKDKKTEIIDVYLDALIKLKQRDEYLEFLQKLSKYDEKYREKFLEESIKYQNYSVEAINLAKEEALKGDNPQIYEFLGDYYNSLKNYKDAIKNYKLAENNGKLAMVYLESGDIKSFEALKSDANSKDLNEILGYEKKYLEEQKLNGYIGVAEKYVKQGRLREAELYYKKALRKNIPYTMKSEIHYKLVDLYYKLEEYHDAEEDLKLIDTKVLNNKYLGNYYYLGGMIYYNLEDYEESSNYFNELVKKFPNTTLSNRGKIYLLKIEKLKNK